ncbi:MAG: nitrile hydratase accessory protein [Ectothiorhodospiraceae bacterium]|nr:nitrile hydratase accessory protein [Ectothiorhodospiraceae bacterium]MCH8505420.1 nitrile hydratase accessory protein [Ectothiorhodospiraceae bacterium]
MNRPDAGKDHPPFAAPWQAQAFALTVHLHQQGVFTWKEWGEHFSGQRHQSAQAGTADAPDRYYLDWVQALEQLLVAKGEADGEVLATLRQAWTDAYLRTPHGEPVTLE